MSKIFSKISPLLLATICTVAVFSCGSDNTVPEPTSSSKVDYYIDYEIDGKKEKYIIDTGHLNTRPTFKCLMVYDKAIDGVNNKVFGVNFPTPLEIMPFGKSINTQTVFPCFSLTMSIFNFSSVKSGDQLRIDSFTANEPRGNAVGLVYYPKAGPLIDSLAEFFDLGLYTVAQGTPFVKGYAPSPSINTKVLGKNGKLNIISKKLIVLGAGNSFYILQGEITGEFMKYKIVGNSNNNLLTRKNLGYKIGIVKFQIPVFIID